MGNKKVLLVYPHNFLRTDMGTNALVFQFALMLKELGYTIDQFGYKNISEDISFSEFHEQNKDGLIENLYLYDFKNNKMGWRFLTKALRLTAMVKGDYVYSLCPRKARIMFDAIVRNGVYDAVIMFYSNFAYFLRGKQISAKKIYFMEDAIFLQQFYQTKNIVKHFVSVGMLLDSELRLIKEFDHVFGISNDEILFFKRLIQTKMEFFPHVKKWQEPCSEKNLAERKWDVLFLGANNPYNVEGMQWFFEKVYPHVNPEVRILLAGAMTKNIKNTYPNVTVIPFIEDLNEAYEETKMVICPMLRGTGMKIKVVEAMERGLPVVCTTRGVDGLPDKMMSGCVVTDDPEKFAHQINKLLSDELYHESISKTLRQYYKDVFDWQECKEKLRQALEG